MGKIILATGQEKINMAVSKISEIEVVSEVYHRRELLERCLIYTPDLLIYSEALIGKNELSSIELLLSIRERSPITRIIYLPGMMSSENHEHVQRVRTLVNAGIYDIFTMKTLSFSILQQFIFYPSSKDTLKDWLEDEKEVVIQAPKAIRKEEPKNQPPKIEQENRPEKSKIKSSSISKYLDEDEAKKLASEVMKQVEEDDSNEYIIKNLFIVSSIKPGTGKSFLSTNIATAIAKYGQVGPDGKKPTVALIEGDLQNLSIGTLLSIEEKKYNLKTAMEKIDLILDSNTGDIKAGTEPVQIDDVDKFIKACFKPYYKVKNLHALVGSQYQPNELNMVTGQHYVYLLESICDLFDVVIVDTNSSLNHVTTYPLLQLANRCYYVLNLDFNNVYNNHRYRMELNNLGIGHKIRYILNEDVSQNRENKEPLIFGPSELEESGYQLEGCIPAIDKSIFLNRLHEGTPIILDETKLTLKARWEVTKIADTIWPMDCLVEFEHEYEKYEGTLIKKKTKRFFGLL